MKTKRIKVDEIFMKRALKLARRGFGKTSPNPCVGCVIVKAGKIVGEGFHKKAGENHAEINALKKAGKSAKGAKMYVTLEPCCHVGRTGPCTGAIIESGIKEVVVAMKDPSLHANGKGVDILRHAGVKVTMGVESEANESREMNQVFLKNVLKKMPYVTLKMAMSLDGKIATKTGDSRGLTGAKAQKFVHQLRAEHDAVLVGAGTVLADNPHLGVRLVKGKSPIRVILDNENKLQKSAQVFRDDNVIVFNKDNGGDAKTILKKLFDMGIMSVLVEGGETVASEFLDVGCVDKYITIIAPKLIGGDAKTPFKGVGVEKVAFAKLLKCVSLKSLGDDLVLTLLLDQ